MPKCFLILSFCALSAWAQGTTARILGEVTDATGAVLPKARITVTNVATNVAHTATSDGAGRYVVPLLPVGEYRVRAELAGFKSLTRDGIVLQIDQTAQVNLRLDVGEVSQSVEVSGAAPMISTDTTDLGSVVDNEQVSEMPLNGRLNIVSLLVLAPGVQDFEDQSAVPTTGINPQIGGGGTHTAAFSLDGGSNTENNVVRGSGSWPSLESVREFKVTSSNASAEFGKGGAQIIMVTKSGTNALHGSVFWFNRNKVFAAQNALVKLAQKPGFNRNEAGLSLGGPVRLPYYRGRDRTFFFVSYEGFRLRSPVPFSQSVATAAMRDGNFSAVTAIKDPLTGQAFPGNIIPASHIHALAARLQSFYPLPNTAGTAAGGTGTNLVTALQNSQNVDRFSIKVDHRISNLNQFSARFNYVNLGPNPNTTVNALFTVPGVDPVRAQYGERQRSILVNDTHTLTPRWINEFRAQYRYVPVFRTPRYANFDPSTVIPGLVSPAFGGLPTVSISGFMSMTDTLPGSRDKDYDTQLIDALTWTTGRHLIKFGYEAERVDHFNIFNVNSAVPNPNGGTVTPTRGALVFNNRYTGTKNGNAWADFLLGDPVVTANPGVAPPTQWRSWRQYAYFQDDIKLRANLTVNLGLRFEYQPVYSNRFGLVSDFDPTLGKVLVFGDRYPKQASPALISSLPIALTANVNRPNSLGGYIGSDANNFGPRVGLAWTPLRRFVFRAGYGIFYGIVPQVQYKDNALLGANPPFIAVSTFESGATSPTLTLSNPFPGAGSFSTNPTLGSLAPHLVSPYSQQWNATLEYDLRGTALRASYVGNHGVHELGTFDLNNAPPLAAAVQPRRPYQPFSAITWVSNAYSHTMNQLQLGARKQYHQGLSLQVQYQFSRALGIENYDDTFHGRISYGNLGAIRRHGIVGSYVYHLPFGKGQRWLNHNRVASAAAGGWELTGIPSVFSGAPFSPSFSQSTAGCPGGRPDIVADPIPGSRNIDHWFVASAYKAPTGCRYGTAPINSLFGPATIKWDTGLLRNIRIWERTSLQFRGEAFNVLNHPIFGTPQSNISSANAGRITSSSGERQLQFALKLVW